MAKFKPVTLYKGDATRTAHSEADLVRFKFDGFKTDEAAGKKVRSSSTDRQARRTPTASTQAQQSTT